MNGARFRHADWRTVAAASAVVAAALVIVLALLDPKAAAAGWLIGLAFWSQILVGSLTLIMIYRLTGGRWGPLLAPSIAPAAMALPLLLVLAVPLFLALATLYPWPHQPVTIKPDVLSYYLNTPTFILRTVVALVGWSGFALLLSRTHGRLTQVLAALGLVFNALAISTISIDWYLSLEAPFDFLVWCDDCHCITGRGTRLGNSRRALTADGSRTRRFRRSASRYAARPYLHELYGRARHLVRRSSHRIRLVCRAY